MSEMTRRVLMTVLGVSASGVAVGFFSLSGMGFDPFQCFSHGVWSLTPLDFGTFYAIVNAVLLVLILLVNRKKVGLGTLINLFLLGYIAEGSEDLLRLLGPDPSLPVRFLFLVIGINLLCFASAVYFTGDLGVSTYDAVAITIAERQKKVPFRLIRIGTDLVCVGIGFALGAPVGIGTLVTAFFMGPLIDLFRRTAAEPMRYGRRTQ